MERDWTIKAVPRNEPFGPGENPPYEVDFPEAREAKKGRRADNPRSSTREGGAANHERIAEENRSRAEALPAEDRGGVSYEPVCRYLARGRWRYSA